MTLRTYVILTMASVLSAIGVFSCLWPSKEVEELVEVERHVEVYVPTWTACTDGVTQQWHYESFVKWTPDGSRILFDARAGEIFDPIGLYVVDTKGPMQKIIASSDSRASTYHDYYWQKDMGSR